MSVSIKNENKMISFGKSIGALLRGGEIIELIGDVGSGKTTLVKGIAAGLGIEENIQSPSFTINRMYEGRNHITLAHYDFYRLAEAGIMTEELQEIVNDNSKVTVIEWSNIVKDILPSDRLSIKIIASTATSRELTIFSGGAVSKKLQEQLTL